VPVRRCAERRGDALAHRGSERGGPRRLLLPGAPGFVPGRGAGHGAAGAHSDGALPGAVLLGSLPRERERLRPLHRPARGLGTLIPPPGPVRSAPSVTILDAVE